MSEHKKARTVANNVDADYSLEAVPVSARKGFWNMFFVMLGFTFFSASMSVGAKLGNGLDLSGFIWACIIGGIILSVYCGILAYIGSETGLTMDLLCRRTFGTKGSYLSSLILGFTQIGWFGVGVAMFSIPAAELLGINEWVLTIAAGLLMTATAATGMKALEIVSYISVPLIMVLGVYSMATATSAGGGLATIFAQSAGGITLFTGIGYVIGSFISGGTATPNFIRFAKNSKIAVWTTVIAFFLGNTLMFCFGGVAGAFTGTNDIFWVMIELGLGVWAFIVLGANIWTTNDNALYTGALGLANITGKQKKPMVILSGVIGTVAAMWLYNNFCNWLTILNATLPAVGVILVADYFIDRKKYAADAEETKATNWAAIIGVVAGAVVGNLTGGNIIPGFTWGIAAVNNMVVSLACYLIGKMVNKK